MHKSFRNVQHLLDKKEQASHNPENLNRVEVIDETGRVYTKDKLKKVELSWQDGGKTLKIFINK